MGSNKQSDLIWIVLKVKAMLVLVSETVLWADIPKVTLVTNPVAAATILCKAHGYFLSRTASLSFGQQQIILLGDRSTRVTNLPKVALQQCLTESQSRDL